MPFLKRIKNVFGTPLALVHDMLECTPVVAAYTMIQWALKGKTDGDGYGFPFDQPHLRFAQRLRQLNTQIKRIKDIHLRGRWQDNKPYFKIHKATRPLIQDRSLWKAVETMEAKTVVFEELRKAMLIALPDGVHGLNDEGQKGHIRKIESRVKKFREWVVRQKTIRKILPHKK